MSSKLRRKLRRELCPELAISISLRRSFFPIQPDLPECRAQPSANSAVQSIVLTRNREIRMYDTSVTGRVRPLPNPIFERGTEAYCSPGLGRSLRRDLIEVSHTCGLSARDKAGCDQGSPRIEPAIHLNWHFHRALPNQNIPGHLRRMRTGMGANKTGELALHGKMDPFLDVVVRSPEKSEEPQTESISRGIANRRRIEFSGQEHLGLRIQLFVCKSLVRSSDMS